MATTTTATARNTAAAARSAAAAAALAPVAGATAAPVTAPPATPAPVAQVATPAPAPVLPPAPVATVPPVAPAPAAAAVITLPAMPPVATGSGGSKRYSHAHAVFFTGLLAQGHSLATLKSAYGISRHTQRAMRAAVQAGATFGPAPRPVVQVAPATPAPATGAPAPATAAPVQA